MICIHLVQHRRFSDGYSLQLGRVIRVVGQVRFGLCWFGFSSSGFLGRAVLVLLGCHDVASSTGYRIGKTHPSHSHMLREMGR